MDELIKEIFFEEKTEEEGLDIKIKFSLGSLKISPFSGEKIYHLDAEYPNENYTPIIKYSKGTIGILQCESQKIGSSLGSTFSIDKVLDLFSREKRGDTIKSNSNKWDLKLNRELPAELNVEGGASEQRMELGGMMLKYLKVSTGASLTSVTFSEHNKERLEMKVESGAASFEAHGLGFANLEKMKFDGGVGKSLLNFAGDLNNNATIELSGGLGLIELEIPSDTGARIGASSKKFLSMDNIPDTYTRSGDLYINQAYDESKPHLTINVDIALGSLKIREI
jgi:hypothetical protein